MSDNDLTWVMALINKRKTMRSGSGQTDTTALDDPGSARVVACWAAIDVLLPLFDKLCCVSSAQTQTLSGGDRTALVLAPSQPSASQSLPSLAQPYCRRCSTAYSSPSGPAAPDVLPALSMPHRNC
ncbi:hypothetical protein KTQ42_18220 [Noviherbaspirillum sp. L7-7A]|uniref:hypothetical protein n=1 Tax=Noviherbaspirillum sp. L7-7A TaxID=2850560 RepID=UPI001C2C933A|nr:hypothetical protein [Noviherbaspirillum sp. L7-7A]MBV0881235.1 hypothetical protein [Noviherbaspirillum sp. L7-7A]